MPRVMPGPDNFYRDLHLALAAQLRRSFRKGRKRKPPKGEGGEMVPVEPNRPKTLEGGAAAALEYDD